jgi:zinc D-Ala-D-Ala carboxypeptidase
VRLSTHFTLAEFTISQTASRLGIDNAPTQEALENLKRTAQGLEGVRILLGCPIIISSGYRCLSLNRAIGSKDTSQHVTGEAVDFEAPAYGPPSVVMSRLFDSGLDYDQCILEYPPDGWIHMSFTKTPRHHALIIDRTGARPYMA